MKLRQSLLKNVLAAPEDDGPRLIYADWLEEFGETDSDRARAELIRLQCMAERLEEWSPERMDLEGRAEDLLNEHGENWLQEVPEWVARGGLFRRGFLERVFESYDQFLQWAEELFAAAPVREAQLYSIRDSGRALAECPYLARLRRLTMIFEQPLVDLPVFLASPYLAELTGLTLNYFRMTSAGSHRSPSEVLGDAGAALLADCPRLSRLTALDVSENHIGPEGLAALVASPHLAGIEELNLSDNPIGDAGLERLARSPWAARLTYLNLSGSGIGDAGLRALAARPARLRRLSINIGGDEIGNTGLQALANCEHLTQLREIDVSGWLFAADMRSLAGSPHLSGLRVLRARSSVLDGDLVRELAASPHFRHLRFIELDGRYHGAEGILALARSPVLASLTILRLGGDSNIGDDGIAALASSEFLSELRQLDLAYMGLGSGAARTIARSPYLSKLRELNLMSNLIGDEGGRALCESPYLGRLRDLYLDNCGISDKVTKALRERFGKALHI